MKKHFLFLVLISLFSFGTIKSHAVETGTFTTGNNEFLLNGKPFIIRAGELHYSRIPKPYWENRIQMLKAMGMNTVCIYLFWNIHEQEQGKYDFTGQNNVAEFVKLVQKNDMYCIVRPGPYVCAEWDMGGLPWWLLKKDDIKVRSREDAFFMENTKKFLNVAGKQLAKYQIQNGGPIIMVQVENEYGVWGKDGQYMKIIRDNIREAGFDKVQLFRCDWSSNFNKYELEGVASTLNFGAGSNIDNQFKEFKKKSPEAPLMCSEYWTGWFDQWGRPHETRSVQSFIGSLKDMMDKRISFSLYMAHGGTSFGQWAGANAPSYAPTTSSYDYNAPIDEAGNPTEKFYAIRNLLKNYLQEGEILPEVPVAITKTIVIPEIKFTESAPLFENLPKSIFSKTVKPMEYFDQGWGSIMYRTKISASAKSRRLKITNVHDWASIFIDGKLIGTIDRRKSENSVILPPSQSECQLDILVEGLGRVNYGEAIIDRKGITNKVELTDENSTTEISNWEIFNFPVDYRFQKKANFKNSAQTHTSGWYKANFSLKETGYTYLDMRNWGKGMVWINGHNLGRFWKIGPTQTLCVPECFLKKGNNEIIVFDINSTKTLTTRGLNHAILDEISVEETQVHRKPDENLDLSGVKSVYEGTVPDSTGWHSFTFDNVKKGRYFCFEALNSQIANDPYTSVAEIELLDEAGKKISTLDWKVLYADSEEVKAINNAADKLFDLQESVIWHTSYSGTKTSHPHQVVIDLGEVKDIKSFKILPRSDKSKNGNVKDFKLYLELNPFKF